MPKEIPKSQQGRELCQALGENTKLCVESGKYGYSAWITSTDGKKLAPISVGVPSTIKQALKLASAQARRIALFGVDDRPRGGRPRNPDGTLTPPEEVARLDRANRNFRRRGRRGRR